MSVLFAPFQLDLETEQSGYEDQTIALRPKISSDRRHAPFRYRQYL